MDDFNFNTKYNFEFDPISFNDLDEYNPFEGLPLLDRTSPPLTQVSDLFNDVGPQSSIIQEHELRPYLEGLDVLWSPITSSSSSQSPPTSPVLPDPSAFAFAPVLPLELPEYPPIPPIHTIDLAVHSQESTLFSPETVTSSYDFGSPSSSSSGPLMPSPSRSKRARTLSVKEESEVEESSKRARTSSSDSPVHLVFLTVPQPAYSSTIASTSRLPIATPAQARCHCVFKRGNQKPARHWRTACPYNPDRDNPATKFRCEVKGCSMEFGRRDNRDRHVRKFH